MRMLSLSLILFSYTVLSHAQDQQNVKPRDTTLRLFRFSSPVVLSDTPAFTLPFAFALSAAGDELPQYFYLSFDESPPIYSIDRQTKIDLTAPLKLQLQKEDNNRAWKITLGAANYGAVAYIAYQHIKKYGLK